jgi:hypothetical protein
MKHFTYYDQDQKDDVRVLWIAYNLSYIITGFSTAPTKYGVMAARQTADDYYRSDKDDNNTGWRINGADALGFTNLSSRILLNYLQNSLKCTKPLRPQINSPNKIL